MTETLLLNEDLEREYQHAYASAGLNRNAHLTALRAVALFVARGGSQPEWDHCKACGGKILGTKYGEGRSYDGPGVPHVCKPPEPHPGNVGVYWCGKCQSNAVTYPPHVCKPNIPGLQQGRLEYVTDAGKVTREELDAVKRDVRTLAKVLGAPGVVPGRELEAVWRIAEGR